MYLRKVSVLRMYISTDNIYELLRMYISTMFERYYYPYMFIKLDMLQMIIDKRESRIREVFLKV